MQMAELISQAGVLAQKGRSDIAAVYFAAAAQQEGLSDAQKFAARSNAALLGEKVAESTWGTTAMAFVGDPRHQAVCDAIAAASKGGKRVLILGSAAGLYAVAASEAGASHVLCLEANGLAQSAASSVVRARELDNVQVDSGGPPPSVGDARGPQFDVLVVAERCWGSSLTRAGLEEVVAAFPSLAQGGVVIPSSVSILAQAVESVKLRDSNFLDVQKFEQESGLNYAAYNNQAQRSRLACHLATRGCYRELCAPAEVLTFDLQGLAGARGGLGSDTTLEGLARLGPLGEGRLDGVVTWTEVRLASGSQPLDWPPGGSCSLGTCWVYCHFPASVRDGGAAVAPNATLQVGFRLERGGVWLTEPRAPGDTLGLSAYHTSMLQSDAARTRAYRLGIERAVQQLRNQGGPDVQVRVMDIGAGTGFLSACAARAGAWEVLAVERTPGVAALAASLLKSNGLLREEAADGSAGTGGSVAVCNCMSTELAGRPGEAPRPDLIVSEIFGTDPLSESVLPVLQRASEDFAPTGGGAVAMLPCRCRLWGALARAPAAWMAMSADASNCGVEYGEVLTPFESGTLLVDLRHEFSCIGLCTAPAVLAIHSLAPPIATKGENLAELPLLAEPRALHELLPGVPSPEAEKGRRCNQELQEGVQGDLCLLLWFDADCTLEPNDDPETRISTAPTVERGGTHWAQFAQMLRWEDIGEGVEAALAKGKGDIRIKTTWRVDRTQFSIEVADSPGRGRTEAEH